ncbi:MAG: hypothetical protein KTR14_07105 [Vampirovibrio sp.]|nr:hypothetical protein [Vampirovibrio sp.]
MTFIPITFGKQVVLSDSQKECAVFGGAFDPPHVGHELMIEEARKQHGIDRFCFLPTGNTPLKPNISLFQERLEMLKAFASYLNKKIGDGKNHFEISTAYQHTPNFMDALRRLFPDLATRKEKVVFMAGSDAAVLGRDENKLLGIFGNAINALEFYKRFVLLINKRGDEAIPTKINIGGKKADLDYAIQKLSPKDQNISSTIIRTQLNAEEDNAALPFKVPKPVLGVIQKLKLYGSNSTLLK